METESRERRFKEVENLAKQGAELVREGKLKKALAVYESAYSLAKDLGDEKREKDCAFNVGAVYIELGFPEKGIEMLTIVQRPGPHSTSTRCGDLFFNLGVASENLRNTEQAINFYQQALELYDKEDDYPNQGSICIKLARIYSQMKYFADSATYYGRAARAFGIHQDLGKQVSCKCEQANQLFSDSRKSEALALAEDCLEKCSKLSGDQYLGFMYNDLGLIFTQCMVYDKAKLCFNMGLEETRKPNGDEKQQAVLLQNLGAICNFLGEYRKSLQFHEEAAAKYAKQKNRIFQGQCFCNQAFAYSQLGEYELASEAFLHALQAAKDSEDKHSQWQILEGLGVVSFNLRNINKSIKFFKEALAALSHTDEVNHGCQDRLVEKLTKALEIQVLANTNPDVTMEDMIADVQPTQTLRASFEDKRLKTSSLIPMLGRRTTSQEVVNGRVVATRPGSQRFQTVPRGLSLESFGERVFSYEGQVWGQGEVSQSQQGGGEPDRGDVHLSRYEEVIRRREMEETSEEEESYSEEDSDEESDSEEYETSSEEYSTESSDHNGDRGGKPDHGILIKPSTSHDNRERPVMDRGVSFERNVMPVEIHQPAHDERLSNGHMVSRPLQEDKECSLQKVEVTSQPEPVELRTKRARTDDVRFEESVAHHKTTEKKMVQENSHGRQVFDEGQLADQSGDKPVMKAELTGGINDERAFLQPVVEISEDTEVKVPVGAGLDAESHEVNIQTVAEKGSADEVLEYSGNVASDQEFMTDRLSGHTPGIPTDSCPWTPCDTYETPVVQAGNVDHRPPQKLSPDYAEIDFTASGRPIQGSTPRSSGSGDRPQTSNFFYSDEEGDMKELSVQPTVYEEEGEEEEEGLYESIHPREEAPTMSNLEAGVAELPRGQREQLLYQEHQKQLAQQTKTKPEKKSRSKMCSVM